MEVVVFVVCAASLFELIDQLIAAARLRHRIAIDDVVVAAHLHFRLYVGVVATTGMSQSSAVGRDLQKRMNVSEVLKN